MGMLTAATPERPSTASKLTVTSVLLQPLAFGGGLATTASVGGVLSMLIPVTEADATFPALSSQKPVMVMEAEALLTVEAGMICAPLAAYVSALIPEPPWFSTAVRATVTSVLFQPWRLGPGAGVAFVTGGVRSVWPATGTGTAALVG